nr:MAG: ORF1 [TTV-like mini virus]
MPPYWRNYWNRRRRRYRFRPRRFRKTFFRRHRRWRRRRWVRRKFKLRSIKIRQFQPKSIRLCHVKGLKCLFQGSSLRLSYNYWQYPHSYVPEGRAGGGGWGLMALSLASLYEDYQHLQNIFTASNAALPLVRYKGVYLTFYQEQYVDYVVEIDNCWPMLDTPLKHPNCQPARMMMSKRKLIIPSIETKPLKKRKRKIFVPPPSQMENKWYFQKDLCNTKLIMIAASACSLTHYYLPLRAKSNNATIWILDTHLFKNADFQHYPATTGYQMSNNRYLYTLTEPPGTADKTKIIFLGNVKDNRPGKAGDTKKTENWGNPFYTDYLTGKRTVYLSVKSPTDETWQTSPETINQNLQEVHGQLAYKVRYNPDRDTGEGNTSYFVDNYRTSGDKGFDKPQDPNRIIDGFPLWIMHWGWPDWIKKLAEIHRVDDDYIMVTQTSFFSSDFPMYVYLDDDFVQGKGPYGTAITSKDMVNWYPKFLFQQQSVENICETGPGVNRQSKLHSVQAKMKYDFILKWGGCPSTLEKMYDPCSQPKWPTPGNLYEGVQIQSPGENPEKIFYSWDVRRDFITNTALERLKKDSKPVQSSYTATGTRSDVPALQTYQEEDQTSTSEEEEETLKQKLLRLRRNQLKLQQHLLGLINSK